MKQNTSTKVRQPRNASAMVAKCAVPAKHTAHGVCDGSGTGRTPRAAKAKAATPVTPVVRDEAARENDVIAGLATAPRSARVASAERKAAVKAKTALPTRAESKAAADAKVAAGSAAIRVEDADGKVVSPKPAKATPTATVSRKAEMARAMVNALVPVLKGFTPEEQQAAVNMIHHFPTGKTATGARYWPEGILRPDRSDWK